MICIGTFSIWLCSYSFTTTLILATCLRFIPYHRKRKWLQGARGWSSNTEMEWMQCIRQVDRTGAFGRGNQLLISTINHLKEQNQDSRSRKQVDASCNFEGNSLCFLSHLLAFVVILMIHIFLFNAWYHHSCYQTDTCEVKAHITLHIHIIRQVQASVSDFFGGSNSYFWIIVTLSLDS